MKPCYDVVVVIPAGPGTNIAFLKDTIDSYRFYSRCSSKIILIDDSACGLGKQLAPDYPDVDILVSKKPLGVWAGLYVTLSRAFKHALSHYQFQLLFKMDTDALVIGHEPENEAAQLLKSNSQMGIAGQYKFDYHGRLWDTGWPRDRVLNGATTWRFVRRPLPNIVLRKLYVKAVKNGYDAGESVFGGACFYNYHFLHALQEHKLLAHPLVGRLNLGEDHLFSLMAKAHLPWPGKNYPLHRNSCTTKAVRLFTPQGRGRVWMKKPSVLFSKQKETR